MCFDTSLKKKRKKKKNSVMVAETEMSDSSNFLSSTVLAIYSN